MSALDLGLLAPRQAEDRVEIVADDGSLGRHRRHGLELLQLANDLLARFLRQFRPRDLFLDLGGFILGLVTLAELALDRLHLLVEIIFALGFLHLTLDPAADLLLDLEDAHFAFHEAEHRLEPLGDVFLREQGLLVGDLEREIGRDRVSEPPRILDLADLYGNLWRGLLVQLHIGFELLDRRPDESLDQGQITDDVLDILCFADKIWPRRVERRQPRPRLPLDQHLDRAVGQLEQLQHRRQRAEVIKLVGARIFVPGILLADQEHLLVTGHDRFERLDRLIAADEQRHDHLREYHDVAQRQDR